MFRGRPMEKRFLIGALGAAVGLMGCAGEDDTARLLKGSWNVVTVTVPAGAIGSKVGVEFKTGGAFTAYLDAVTWSPEFPSRTVA